VLLVWVSGATVGISTHAILKLPPADYLALMAVRVGLRLTVQFDLPAELRELAVPPLLLQPLVEFKMVWTPPTFAVLAAPWRASQCKSRSARKDQVGPRVLRHRVPKWCLLKQPLVTEAPK
jgi:hypothetical protein